MIVAIDDILICVLWNIADSRPSPIPDDTCLSVRINLYPISPPHTPLSHSDGDWGPVSDSLTMQHPQVYCEIPRDIG